MHLSPLVRDGGSGESGVGMDGKGAPTDKEGAPTEPDTLLADLLFCQGCGAGIWPDPQHHDYCERCHRSNPPQPWKEETA
jgi:hypothetical protein